MAVAVAGPAAEDALLPPATPTFLHCSITTRPPAAAAETMLMGRGEGLRGRLGVKLPFPKHI